MPATFKPARQRPFILDKMASRTFKLTSFHPLIHMEGAILAEVFADMSATLVGQVLTSLD